MDKHQLIELTELTDPTGKIVESVWLTRAERVHRQLRPQLPDDYTARLSQIFANGGRMLVVCEAEEVRALAVWRIIENTYEGRRLYVDDLVTDEAHRSCGFGKTLLDWLQARATQLDCDSFALDSGVQRAEAHRFYFREGMSIPAFCFRKVMK